MIVFIFVLLLGADVLFVPAAVWAKTAAGFLVVGPLPGNMDFALLAVFAATAGSGGLGNLAVSNWTRDKGLGMAAGVGSIGGVFAGDGPPLAAVGRVFAPTADNLRRWAVWWKYALFDQTALWALGCLAGMYLNVNLALA